MTTSPQTPALPQPEDDAETCGVFDHEWGDHYYGYECTKCGMFIPFGSEPWMPIDEYEEDEYDYD